jgi:voltage-gated potassium channel
MDLEQKKKLNDERTIILKLWMQWFEIPLILLGCCWLVLIILEFTQGLSPFLETVSFTIWIIFLIDFFIRFLLAPLKVKFLKSQWITLVALAIPAFRIFNSFEVMEEVRGYYLVRVFTGIRHGMEILGETFGRHGFGYIVGLTVIVILIGSAGMYALEGKFVDYGEAVWWTAMLMTTLGSDYWPKTPEGQVLCLGLALYALAIFAYIVGNFVSFFIEKGRKEKIEKNQVKDNQNREIDRKKS